MFRIRLRRRVAVGALEDGVVRRVRVACGADSIGPAVVHREPGVVERRAKPIRSHPSCVTGGARRRKARRSVIRVRRPGVIGLVARIAIGWCSGEDAANMATGARHVHVRSLQRKWRVVMVENSAEPIRRRPGRVADCAVLRESRGHMVRDVRERSRVVVIFLVAAVASGRQSSRVVPA